MIENCEHCRWKKDLVKIEYLVDRYIHTGQDGYACIALSNEILYWMVGLSPSNETCEMFTPKEE